METACTKPRETSQAGARAVVSQGDPHSSRGHAKAEPRRRFLVKGLQKTKPGAAIPACNNTNHTQTCSNTNPQIPLRAQSVATLCAHPTARRQHGKGTYRTRMQTPALPLEVMLPSSPQPAPGVGNAALCFTACFPSAQAAGRAGEECHCSFQQRGQASPRGSPELQLGWGGCPT